MSSRFLIGEGAAFVENVHTLPLEQKGLRLYRGWNDAIAEQLVERSKEAEIRQYTGRDATERFVSKRKADEWYKDKGHVVYALCQKAALAGVAWFGRAPKPELGADYTFAIRMYQAQRGKGLAGALLEAAHRDFGAHMHYEKSFWLESDQSNRRAVEFYQKHGYEVVETRGDRVLMVRR